jgi:hypothetical protein
MTQSAPTAAWYPDPAGSDQLRYWDGAAWTQHLRPTTPPLAMAATAPSAMTGVMPAAAAPGPTRSWDPYAEAIDGKTALPTSTIGGSPAPTGQLLARPESDPYRARADQPQPQVATPNPAATSALIFAAVNIGILVVGVFLNIAPFFRLVPSLFGVVASIIALVKSGRSGSGRNRSLLALALNGLVALISILLLAGLMVGTFSGIGSRPPSTFADSVEIMIEVQASEALRFTEVKCPDTATGEPDTEFTCQGMYGGGQSQPVLVRVAEDGSIVFWAAPRSG